MSKLRSNINSLLLMTNKKTDQKSQNPLFVVTNNEQKKTML